MGKQSRHPTQNSKTYGVTCPCWKETETQLSGNSTEIPFRFMSNGEYKGEARTKVCVLGLCPKLRNPKFSFTTRNKKKTESITPHEGRQ